MSATETSGNDILDQIDRAVHDWTVSGDAMRWRPDPPAVPMPISLRGHVRWDAMYSAPWPIARSRHSSRAIDAYWQPPAASTLALTDAMRTTWQALHNNFGPWLPFLREMADAERTEASRMRSDYDRRRRARRRTRRHR